MLDISVHEQRSEVRKLRSLIQMADGGNVSQFEGAVKKLFKDNLLIETVDVCKEKAKELYQKDLEVRAFNAEFEERPEIGAETRWNVTPAAKVPEWIVRGEWNDREFYQKYVSKLLTLEVERKQKSILSLERQDLGIAR